MKVLKCASVVARERRGREEEGDVVERGQRTEDRGGDRQRRRTEEEIDWKSDIEWMKI